LRHLQGLDALETLDVRSTAVSNVGLAYLAGHPRLRSLIALGTRVTPRGKQELERTTPNVTVTIE